MCMIYRDYVKRVLDVVISFLALSFAVTLQKINSFSMHFSADLGSSTTFIVFINLFNCLQICSITNSSPTVTIVILEKEGSIVAATDKLSILYPLVENKSQTQDKIPGSFFTKTDIVCRIIILPILLHLIKELHLMVYLLKPKDKPFQRVQQQNQ